MESIESNNNLQLRPLSVLSPSGRQGKTPLQKNSSADSLLSMIKNLTVSNKSNNASTPSSPQFSDVGDVSSGFPTPLTTPETPVQMSFGSGSPSRNGKSGNQIMVEVHDHPADDSDSSQSATGSGNPAGSMTLEVPGFHYGKCLSPIKELPSPLPTPSASPLPNRPSPQGSQDELSSSSTSGSSPNSSSSSKRLSFRNRFRKKSVPTISSNKDGNEVKKEFGGVKIPFLRRSSYAGSDSNSSKELYQETSFVVPSCMQTKQPQSLPIPTITFTVHETTDDEAPQQECHSLPLINVQAATPSSSEAPSFPFASQLPTNILIPQLVVSCDDDYEEEPSHPLQQEIPIAVVSVPPPPQVVIQCPSPVRKTPKVDSTTGFYSYSQQGNGIGKASSHESTSNESKVPVIEQEHQPNPPRPKWRPPPIKIPNSNFKLPGSKNEPKDTASKPIVEIELEEINPKKTSPGCQVIQQKPIIMHKIETTIPQVITSPKSDISEASADSSSMSASRASLELSSPIKKTSERSTSPVQRRTSLVKQKEAVESVDIEIAETPPVILSEVVSTPTCSRTSSVDIESPKMLLAPVGFDSAPRSRSQSVELPEFRLAAAAGKVMPQLLISSESVRPKVSSKIAEHPRMEFDSEKRLAQMMRQRSLAESSGGESGPLNVSTPPPSNKTEESSWKGIKLGSPTLRKDPPSFPQIRITTVNRTGSAFPPKGSDPSAYYRCYDKPQSLDLPGMAPAITVTPMSEIESDGDSPIVKVCPVSTQGMHYLSPFTTINTCGSRTTSESNLSSSGYSSMASPGPSRSGSINICISESEDASSSTPTSSSGFFTTSNPGHVPQGVFMRRPSPLLKSPSVDSESSDPTHPHINMTSSALRREHALRKMQERAFALRYR